MSFPSLSEGLYYFAGILTTVVAIVSLALWDERKSKQRRQAARRG